MEPSNARPRYGLSVNSTAWPRSVLVVAAALFVSSSVRGQSGVILHEYIPPDVIEDLRLGVLTPSGKMPAVVRTSSGLVSAPDKLRSPSEGPTPEYGATASRSASKFRIDGTTNDPGTLHYHEPFRPSIAPFKRLNTFDAVNDAFELYLHDSTREAVRLEGSPEAGEDEFFGDITVSSGNNVRIPSVASKMHILAADLEPPVPFRILVDRGENWFFQAPTLLGKARLIVRVAAPRAAFSPQFDAGAFAALRPMLPNVPLSVVRVVEPMFSHLGVSRTQTPATAVRTLIGYFRGFVPSEQGIAETSGRELYEQLTLTRKGVCRHRAYAFVVTALVLGIPARFVHNEAHAWVEVYDGQLWHRVDLGGAASGMHYDGEKPEGPAYRMGKDNYPWPAAARPGDQLNSNRPDDTVNDDSTSASGPGAGTGTKANGSASSLEAATASSSVRPSDPDQATSRKPSAAEPGGGDSSNIETKAPEYGEPSPEPRNKANVKFNVVGNTTLHRGETIVIEGSVQSEGNPCALTRVDLELRKDAERYLLGSAATDERGHFHAQTTIPQRLGVGPYQLSANSAESASCATSRQ